MAKTKLPKYLPAEDWEKVFATCNLRTPTGARDYAMYLLMWRTGLRVGEVVNLRTKDLNRKTGRVRVPAEGKSGERIVFYPVDSIKMRDALDRYEARARSMWEDPEHPEPWYFLNEHGEQTDRITIYRALVRRGKKAHIAGNVTPHMLRHSFAVDFLERTGNLKALQDALGHADISTTTIYAKLLPDKLREMMGGFTDF